jgi:hypothetical protein
MKKISFIILLLLSISNNLFSQDGKLKNKDEKINHEMIKSGKLIQEIKHPKASPGYCIIMKDSIRIEYSENGKYYTKSKLEFIKPNHFISIAYETTIPGYDCHLSEKIEVKILQTSTKDNLIRVKERINKGKWVKFLLRKLEN